jgi:hypothetical protein
VNDRRDSVKYVVFRTSRTVFREGESVLYRCLAQGRVGAYSRRMPLARLDLRPVEVVASASIGRKADSHGGSLSNVQVLPRGSLPTRGLSPGAYEFGVSAEPASWSSDGPEIVVLLKPDYEDLWVHLTEQAPNDSPPQRVALDQLLDLARACMDVQLGDPAWRTGIRVWLGAEDRTTRAVAIGSGAPPYEWVLNQLLAMGHEMVFLGGRLSVQLVITDEQLSTRIGIRATQPLEKGLPAFAEYLGLTGTMTFTQKWTGKTTLQLTHTIPLTRRLETSIET